MASRFCKLVISDINLIKSNNVRFYPAIKVYGKPPHLAKNFETKLAEMNYKDPAIYYKVDIGLPFPARDRREITKTRLKFLREQRKNSDIEIISNRGEHIIPLADVSVEWQRTIGPFHLKNVAEHYGIFNDLFGDAYFYPQVPLDISFRHGDDLIPVFRGNDVKPSQATQAPEVNYEADADTLWTLILTNPDGHLSKENSEYVHWFIGNIPGNDLKKGEVVWDYLQPFPPFGTGFHRFVFVLYKQEKRIDYSKLKKAAPCLDLNERTFVTYDFYREHQDDLTPGGLAFFQCDWDSSLTDFFHKTLDMKEPVFEYDFPPPYIRKQEWFPRRMPFNIYLDKYRDQKEVSKDILLRKLKNVHPFKKAPPQLPFPNAVPIDKKVPSWLVDEIKRERQGWGRAVYHNEE
ncbi:39S ribosomal protein L38, mitochondrial [Nilaparvata lugens]|uniref:39S ribosomal protein L38, mitochondrial n=1 Tax=Nilaparvata lugens TaxID=108931 RepID=UPI00193D0E3C|nr:39S ribosomal protein L38, mitochondrial [Nilaparvata lugens]